MISDRREARQRALGRLAAPLALALLAWVALVFLAPTLKAQAGGRLAAASENPLASREAVRQMQKGGNAVDAAVTAALVGGVASPTSSGIGGGGFALVWDAKERQPFLLDFRETAPAKLDAAAFERRPLPDDQRGQLIGVPGEVAGLFALHQRFGKRKWSEVVEPAVRLAKNGFPVVRHLGEMLRYGEKKLRPDPNLAAVYFAGGKPAAVGQRLKNPKLGATLERIAAEGPKALYEGAIANDIVAAAQRIGGRLSTDDLAGYRPVERKPIHVRWEGHDVYTMPAPSAGGMMVAQTLRLYSKKELEKLGFNTPAYQHMTAEAMRGAIADRMRFLGDPDYEKVDMDGLISKERMAKRKAKLALDRTHALPRFGLEEHGTHHLVTADGAGNMVSLTTTVNHLFGIKATGESSGIVLNNELDDFSSLKDVEPFGMKQSPNRARPGARPVSSMTPTIVVKNGQAVLALGGSGGTTIASNVTQLLLSNLAFGHSPAEATKARRFYVPTRRVFILLEKGAKESHVADLEWRGEIVGTMPFTSSAVQMIAVQAGRKQAAADPRKHGLGVTR